MNEALEENDSHSTIEMLDQNNTQNNQRISSSVTEPLELVFENLSYQVKLKKKRRVNGVDKKKNLLDNLTGIFRPGRLTAIMGASGAGKTTLLSILAGNSGKGTVSGTISVNGTECNLDTLRDMSGFVFQDDILLPYMKVREAIEMSAILRLPKKISSFDRKIRVQDTIHILELENAKNTIVGSTMQRGISGGERKRTAIGMEMVINSPMLFLDEPTTGLDTFTAFKVMKSLSGLAKNGRIVVVTIHQPSYDIFNLFDDLVILSRGKIAYFGPAKESISYFASLGFQCPRFTNPADYFFMHVLREFGRTQSCTETESKEAAAHGQSTLNADDQIDKDLTVQSNIPENTYKNQCDLRINKILMAWPESEYAKNINQLIQNGLKNGFLKTSLRQYPPFHVQFKFLLARAAKNLFRNTILLISRLAQAVFLGLIVGLTYLNDDSQTLNVQLRNKSGALFYFSVNVFFAAATSVLNIFSQESQVFYREYNGGYYSLIAYYISKTMVEIPGLIIGPFLMVLIAYYLIGLDPPFSSYLMTGLLAALGAICGNSLGIFMSACIEDLNVAMAIVPNILLPFILVSGIFVAEIKAWVSWIKYISPIYYSFSGMIYVQFQGSDINCDTSTQDCSKDRAYTRLNFFPTFPSGVDAVFLLLIYSILWVGGFIALYLHSRAKK